LTIEGSGRGVIEVVHGRALELPRAPEQSANVPRWLDFSRGYGKEDG
jgi:hypothetical protein